MGQCPCWGPSGDDSSTSTRSEASTPINKESALDVLLPESKAVRSEDPAYIGADRKASVPSAEDLQNINEVLGDISAQEEAAARIQAIKRGKDARGQLAAMKTEDTIKSEKDLNVAVDDLLNSIDGAKTETETEEEGAAGELSPPKATQLQPQNSAGLAAGEEGSVNSGAGLEALPKVDFPHNAKYKFNTDPDATMKKLCKGDEELGWRPYTAQEVAIWFLTTEGLSTNKIGACLGSSKEFNIEVMKHFTSVLHFQGLGFDAALRYYLSLFKLPGEAQQIDRIMQAFADHYAASNPAEFDSADTAYTLAFSVIMLNTDAHSPQIPKKMTCEEFVRNNRGIGVNGADLPEELLKTLYSNIKANEIRIEQREYITMVKLEGWLEKQGGKFKSWKRRWVILSGNVLYYFTNPKDPDPKGWIPLEDVKAKAYGPKAFELSPQDPTRDIKSAKFTGKKDGHGAPLSQGHHKQFVFQAESDKERDKWIKAIRDNALCNRFHLRGNATSGDAAMKNQQQLMKLKQVRESSSTSTTETEVI